MEARFLQTQLEDMLAKPVFLDSDDLRDLNDLMSHVRDSDVLLLLQTEQVLTRPFCLLELVTAVDAGIPIVGVNLHGPKAYDFSKASSLLTHLDAQLPQLNPGAEAILHEYGVDTLDAAHKLSHCVPSVISVPLNASASRNILAATLHDLCEAMARAKPFDLSRCVCRDEWAEARGERSQARSRRPSIDLQAAPAPAPAGEGGPGTRPQSRRASLAAGAGLLEMSKAFPGAAPLAFLLQAS
jgi:hypothetical protein